MHSSTCSHFLHAGPVNPSSSMSRMDSRLSDLVSEIRVGLTMDAPFFPVEMYSGQKKKVNGPRVANLQGDHHYKLYSDLFVTL